MSFRNAEGYQDHTAEQAIYNADREARVKAKARRLMTTLDNMASLAGFVISGDIRLIDRDGNIHKAAELRQRTKASDIFNNS